MPESTNSGDKSPTWQLFINVARNRSGVARRAPGPALTPIYQARRARVQQPTHLCRPSVARQRMSARRHNTSLEQAESVMVSMPQNGRTNKSLSQRRPKEGRNTSKTGWEVSRYLIGKAEHHLPMHLDCGPHKNACLRGSHE